jgi:hypothetical protein
MTDRIIPEKTAGEDHSKFANPFLAVIKPLSADKPD